MAETLTDPTLHGAAPEAMPQPAPQAEARGFRADVHSAGEYAYSFIDVTAKMSLTAEDIRRNRGNLDTLNNRYDGILERQSASDVVSVALESDLLLDYRRDAQRAGYTDVDAMPPELREQIVETAVRNRADDIIAELEAHHPDWSREQVAEAAALRISDIITLLSMDATQREGYRRALFSYRDTQDEIAALETNMETMRKQRRERLSAVGRVAVRAVTGVVNAVRNVPSNIGARTTVAGMTLRQKIGEWYQSRSPEGQKATLFTAAGIALAGIATYIGMRYGAGVDHGGSHGGVNYELASNNTSTDVAPDVIGGHAPAIPHTIGHEVIGGHAPAIPETIGGHAPVVPEQIGTAPDVPNAIGGKAPDVPHTIGNPVDTAGNAPSVPEIIGGDLRGAKTSGELFGHGNIQRWPDTVKVSAWDPQTKDGSLWGISEEMLERSGVKNPSDAQIDKIVDALRPQADANGYLRQGQTLNLRPAIDLLPQLS